MRKIKWYWVLLILAGLSLITTISVSAQESRSIRIIFLHHSCGEGLIEEGQVREGLTTQGYEFFDHGYNGDGLRLADGTWTGENFNVPDDNTDPDGFATIFSQPLHDPPDNTFSELMQYDVIAFKSCYPVSNIWDDDLLAEYQSYYLSIRDTTDRYPEKLFVIVTQPPQVPNNTSGDEALRARAFTDWLASDEYLGGHDNLVTFNFFDMLANDDNVLRRDYRVDQWDAHPNTEANQEIGPLFVTFLDTEIRNYFGGENLPAGEDETEIEQETVESEPMPAGDTVVTDLDEGVWQPDTDGVSSSIACTTDAGTYLVGESSLYVNYALGANGYASCVNQFESLQDWSSSEGVLLYLRSDRAGQEVHMLVYSGASDDPVPFEVQFQTTDASVESWDGIVLTWEEFSIPEWQGESEIDSIDPSRIVSVVFSLESESGTQGQFWVDGLSLIEPEVEEQEVEEEPALGAEEPEEEDDTSRICLFSTVIMPLLMGVIWVMHGRKKGCEDR